MANTSIIYTYIDTELKKEAENILAQLGISPSSAIQMFYSQIALTKSLPLKLQLSPTKPTSIGSMSKDEFDNEIMKGLHSLTSDKTYTIDEVNSEFAREFGIWSNSIHQNQGIIQMKSILSYFLAFYRPK